MNILKKKTTSLRPRLLAAPKDRKINFKQRRATRLAIKAVLKKVKVSFILFGGAIRGGKTFWGMKTLIFLCEMFPGSRWIVLRKDLTVIRDNTIPSFEKLINYYIKGPGELKRSPFNYYHPNGSMILFRGENIDKDPELNKFKGFECNGFLFEEFNELDEKTLTKGFERAGSWIIPGLADDKQPNPILLATTNPTQGFVKRLFFTPWKQGTLRPEWVYIPSYITDNPFLPQSYLDSLSNMNEYEYRVYVLGDWDVILKQGGEFLKEFELEKHLCLTGFDKSKTVHISIDSNVRPYIAVTLWQLHKKQGGGWRNVQFAELPIGEPNNSAAEAGKHVGDYLNALGYENKIFLYGDPTTKASNNIDENKRSFLTLFKTALAEKGFEITERFFNRAPNVSLTGDFINAILAREIFDLSIEIHENCKESINDYIIVKEDKDGGMHKAKVRNKVTGVTYEPHGHLTDTKRYFICKLYEEEFIKYSQRFTDYKKLSEMVSDPESFLKGGI